MQYRPFGKLNWNVSALGFGAMRLPLYDKHQALIDEAEAMRMIRHAIDSGVNYVDTAFNYHNEQSEIVVGRALCDGYRERVRLATKLPCWLVEKSDDFDRFLDRQLGKLQTDRIDFYLLHALGADRWPKMRDLGILSRAERALADGRIGHFGFSFHDSYELFQEIVDATDLWTFCQVQYNLVDTEYQAGTRGVRYAASKGLAVVVMEPLRGGSLARNIPPTVQSLWEEGDRHLEGAGHLPKTPADWALQWVWNQPEVSLVLSGMSTMEQLEQNLASADRSGVGTMSEEELTLVAKVREAYLALCAVPCTACQYCLPCPSKVAIPDVFEIYNGYLMFGDTDSSRMFYSWLDEGTRADACIECGECLEKCPQGIDIPEWMKKVHQALHQQ